MLVLFVSGTIGPRGWQHHDSYFHHMPENTELRKLELKKDLSCYWCFLTWNLPNTQLSCGYQNLWGVY